MDLKHIANLLQNDGVHMIISIFAYILTALKLNFQELLSCAHFYCEKYPYHSIKIQSMYIFIFFMLQYFMQVNVSKH